MGGSYRVVVQEEHDRNHCDRDELSAPLWRRHIWLFVLEVEELYKMGRGPRLGPRDQDGT